MPRIFKHLEAGCLQVNLMSTSAQINLLKYTILLYDIQSPCQFTLNEQNRVMMLTTSPIQATRLVSGCESTSGLLFVIES